MTVRGSRRATTRSHATRVEFGATLVFSPQADLTPYFARQTDIQPRRTSVKALGLMIALHF